MSTRVTSVSHVAICSRDLERSLAFYRDMLGFRVIFDQVQDTTEGGLPYVYKNRHARRRTVHLTWGDGNEPFLVVTAHPGDPPDGEPIKLDQIGINHIAFTVSDLEAFTREMLAKGAKTCGPPDAFKNPRTGKVSSVFFSDPDGILLQFDRARG
ncbi:MAG: VOC family protein [Chloroflexota bacterium]